MPQGWTKLGPLYGSDFSLTSSSIEEIYSWGGDNVAIIIGSNGDGAVLIGSGFTNSGDPNYTANRYTGTVERVELYKNLSSVFLDWEGTPTFSTVDGWEQDNLILSAAIESTSLSTFLSSTIDNNGWSYSSLEQELLSGDDKIDGTNSAGTRPVVHGHDGNDLIEPGDAFLILGGSGNDSIEGTASAAAVLLGEHGSDLFDGSTGSDQARHIWMGGTGSNHYLNPRSNTIIAIEQRESFQAPDIIENIGLLAFNNDARIIIDTDATDAEQLKLRFVPIKLESSDGNSVISTTGYISLSYQDIEQARMTLFDGMQREDYDTIKTKLLNKIGLAPAAALINPEDFNAEETSQLLTSLGATTLGTQQDLNLSHNLEEAYANGFNEFIVESIQSEAGTLEIKFNQTPTSKGSIGIWRINANGNPTQTYLSNQKWEGDTLRATINSSSTHDYKLFFYGNWRDSSGQALEGLASNYYGQNGDIFDFSFTPDNEAPSVSSVEVIDGQQIRLQFSEAISFSGSSLSAGLATVANATSLDQVVEQFSADDISWLGDQALITPKTTLDGTYYLYFWADASDAAGNRLQSSGRTELLFEDPVIKANRIQLDRSSGNDTFLLPIQIQYHTPAEITYELTWKSDNQPHLSTSGGRWSPATVNTNGSEQLLKVDVSSFESEGVHRLERIRISGSDGAQTVYEGSSEINSLLSQWGLEKGSLDVEIKGPATQHELEIESISLSDNEINISNPEELITGTIHYNYSATDGAQSNDIKPWHQLIFEATLADQSKERIYLSGSTAGNNVIHTPGRISFSITPAELQKEIGSSTQGSISFTLSEARLTSGFRDYIDLRLNDETQANFNTLANLPQELTVTGIKTDPQYVHQRELINLSFSHQTVNPGWSGTAIAVQAEAKVEIPTSGMASLANETLRIDLNSESYTWDINSGFESWLTQPRLSTITPSHIETIDPGWAKVEYHGIINIPSNTIAGDWDITRIELGSQLDDNDTVQWSTSNGDLDQLAAVLPPAITITDERRNTLTNPIRIAEPIKSGAPGAATTSISLDDGGAAYLDLVLDLGRPANEPTALDTFYKEFGALYGLGEEFKGVIQLISPSGTKAKTLILSDADLISSGTGIQGIDPWRAEHLAHYQIPIPLDPSDEAGLWRVNQIDIGSWRNTNGQQFQNLSFNALTRNGSLLLDELDTEWLSQLTNLDQNQLTLELSKNNFNQPIPAAAQEPQWVKDLTVGFTNNQLIAGETINIHLSFSFPHSLLSSSDSTSPHWIGSGGIRSHSAGLLTPDNAFPFEITTADITSETLIGDSYRVELSTSVPTTETALNGRYSLTSLELIPGLGKFILSDSPGTSPDNFQIISSDISPYEGYGLTQYHNDYVGALPLSSTDLAVNQLESFGVTTTTTEDLSFTLSGGSNSNSNHLLEGNAEPLFAIHDPNVSISNSEQSTELLLEIDRSSMRSSSNRFGNYALGGTINNILTSHYISVVHESGLTTLLEIEQTENASSLLSDGINYRTTLDRAMPSGSWFIVPNALENVSNEQYDYLSLLDLNDGISSEEADILNASPGAVSFNLTNNNRLWEQQISIQRFEFIEGEPTPPYQMPVQTPLQLEAITPTEINWTALGGGTIQLQDAELDQSGQLLLTTGQQQGLGGVSYVLNPAGGITQSLALAAIKGTDILPGPGQQDWNSGAILSSGSDAAVIQAGWFEHEGSRSVLHDPTGGTVYQLVDGFNLGGKLLDVYARAVSAEPGAAASVEIRVDGRVLNTTNLPLIPHAATLAAENNTLYVLGWNTPERNQFGLYSIDLNHFFRATPTSIIPWTEVNGFAGPALAPTSAGKPWSEIYIEQLIWDPTTDELLFSGGAASYDNNLPTAGFIGSYSPGNPPYPGTNAGVSFPLGFAGAGQSTDTISDVVVINKQYLLAGGHQVVSDSGSDSLAIDNTLYLIDRNNWTVSSRSFDQLPFDQLRDLSLDGTGGVYTAGAGVNHFSSIGELFDLELDLSQRPGGVIAPSVTQYEQLQGHQSLSASQLNQWGSYQLELNAGNETFGSRDIYLLPYATATAFHGGSTPAAYWSMNMGAVDENDIILIDSQVDLNQVAQFANCIWFDANYDDRPLIDTRGLSRFENYEFFNHPDNFEMAYYADYAPVPAQFGQIDFSKVDLNAITTMSSDEFLIHYGSLITNLPSTGSPAYSIKTSSSSINEGQSLRLDVATDQPAGSSLYWSINGANFNSDDLSSGVLEGSQLLDSTGNFSINLNLAADLSTEGSEEIELRLYNDPGRHNRVATSASITINDTSTAPIPTFNADTSKNTIDEGFELVTTLMTEHVAAGSAIWWELDLDDPYTTTITRGALHGSAELDASGQLELSHVFQTSNDSNASLHFYGDAAKTQLLTQTPTITIRDLNLSLLQSEPSPGSTSLAEGSPTTFTAQLPLELADTELHWSLILDDTNTDDWQGPQLGSTSVDAQGLFSLTLSPLADQRTEGGESVEIQIFSDAEHTLPLLQNRARFKVLDTSHFPFDGFPYPDHLYAQFSGTFSSDTNGLDFDLEDSDFYEEIWDRWSGTVTGSNQRELIWHAYSTRTDDRLIANGGDGADHFLGCADRSLEERQPNQPAVGPIRGDANDGYLWIQDFDPSEDLLIFPFNSDQPVQFDGTYLSITTPSGATDRIFQLNDGGFSFQDIRGSLAFLDTISNGAIPTYSLNPSSTTPNEGETLTTSVTTSGLQPGTTLYWSLNGSLSPDDLETGALQGSATLDANGGFSFDHQFRDDLTTEGVETFTLELFQSPERSRILASSNLITLGDTSITIPTQTVQFTANQIPYQPGASLALPLLYSTNTAEQNLPGLTLNVHFDASRLTPSNTNGVLEQLPAAITSNRIAEDQNDLDDDPLTSHFIELIWADFNGTFPGQPLPTVIATLGFHTAPTTPDPITGEDPSTIVRTTASDTAPNYSFLNSSTELRPQRFHLDVDGDGSVTALGDGLMVIRKLFGNAFAGDALTNKAVANNASRSTAEIHSFLEEGIAAGRLDIDRDGQTTALGDGLMIIRHLFGNAFSGSALTSKAISTSSQYYGLVDAPNQISANIDALIPTLSNQI